jgi:O-antigen/teichoic acid export membrane protein
MSASNNKILIKNTLFLYIRMMFIMFVSLYTSRVVLQILGVDDFGLYQVVGGVVGLVSFIGGSLSVGTSRFLTYELGRGDYEKSNRTFCTLLNSHIILALGIVFFSETIGMWFLYNKISIPMDRMNTAVWVYHFSILSLFFAIIQIPYVAAIIADEKMHIYTYISIFDAIVKLGAVFLLRITAGIDRLVFYAFLLCIVQIMTALSCQIFCSRNIKISKYHFIWDKNIFKKVAGFSGWSLFAQAAITLNAHGTNIITNMFFGSGVVTARVIATQVNMAANQFVNNFRTAVNPQIIKKYASGDHIESRQLLLASTKYSYYLMLVVGLPIILIADRLLLLWLGIVPEYSVVFLRLVIIQSIISVFDTSFYTALYAKGRLRENALISPMVLFLCFPVVYVIFKIGFPPVALSYIGIAAYSLLSFVVKPLLIIRFADYSFHDVFSVFHPCIKITMMAVILPVLLKIFLDDSILSAILICLMSIISVGFSVYYIGISAAMRLEMRYFTKSKFISAMEQISALLHIK